MQKLVFLTAIIFYLSSAIFTKGYYHPDEHYQIVEFAELKTGRNTEKDLAWEYADKIRPTIQPALMYVYLTTMRAIGLEDPYVLMVIARLLTAALALFVISKLIGTFSQFIAKEHHLVYAALAYLLWFLPLINVRFSSECYAGLAFMLSYVLFYSKYRSKYLLMGIFMGLAFLFRFQTAFMSLGFIAWLLVYRKLSLNQFSSIFLGGMGLFYTGVLIDYWYYGIFTVTPFNYFEANIVRDVASGFGVSPWYFYFSELLHPGTIVLGLCILISVIHQAIYHYKNAVIWIIVPFVLVHIFTPHKEMRFLFPIANFFPIVLIQLYIQVNDWLKKKDIIPRSLTTGFLIILTALNFISCLTLITAPADENGEGKMQITQYIHQHTERQPLTLWCVGSSNPYHPIPPRQTFYLDANVTQIALDNTVTKPVIDGYPNNLLIIKEGQLKSQEHLLKRFRLQFLKSGLPEWTQRIRSLSGYSNQNNLLLYRIEKTLN